MRRLQPPIDRLQWVALMTRAFANTACLMLLSLQLRAPSISAVKLAPRTASSVKADQWSGDAT
ncbi:hypothetical protein PR003_g12837 [Phytophthora rubi]|uniref:Uncharacterized protein n=2 Tax=Phytophthora rubi TaxID=129364 RepID=A0A6A3KD52_9STRA|nr:hypothetical protein PR002_g17314 [Phytophthora rubi]KAE9335797.1 hypothetical protein PR003_g12837 [Phytophthora rubi]